MPESDSKRPAAAEGGSYDYEYVMILYIFFQQAQNDFSSFFASATNLPAARRWAHTVMLYTPTTSHPRSLECVKQCFSLTSFLSFSLALLSLEEVLVVWQQQKKLLGMEQR